MELFPRCQPRFSCYSAASILSNASHAFLFLPSVRGCHGLRRAAPPHLLLISAVLAERRTPVAEPAAADQATAPAMGEAAAQRQDDGPVSRTFSTMRQRRRVQDGEMGMQDADLESTWAHRAWVATGNLAMAGMMAKAVEAAGAWPELAVAGAGAYILADLATGVYHWAVDNYGDARTPIFGAQIDGFQGHHKRPWTIAKRQFANNIHALARPAALSLAPFLLLPSHAAADCFLAVFLACAVYSQQFHAWAHAKRRHVPPLVSALQDAGLLVSRKMHGAHHRPPYNVNYCIVSGLWNPLIDRLQLFATLEMLIFSVCHVRPRSWAQTSSGWLQDGSYFSDGTDVDDTLSTES